MDYRTAGERYDEARMALFSEFEDTRPIDPKDVAAYDAICDEISDGQIKAFAEYSARFGPAEAATQINREADCLCRRCWGATMVATAGEFGAVWGTCPDCYGTGIDGPYLLGAAE